MAGEHDPPGKQADQRHDDVQERVIRNEETMRAHRAAVKASFKWRDKVLRDQAVEVERRLAELNHENARILAAQSAAVSTDKFDGHVKAYDEWKTTVEAFIATNVSASATSDRNRQKIQQTIFAGFTAATLILSFVVALANGVFK